MVHSTPWMGRVVSPGISLVASRTIAYPCRSITVHWICSRLVVGLVGLGSIPDGFEEFKQASVSRAMHLLILINSELPSE